MSVDDRIEPYAGAIRKLLKGVVYHDDAVWRQIRDYELPIRDYLIRIGLDLHLDEAYNFAFLKDASRDEDKPDSLPALTTRYRLSFIDTLLLVLLRERLDEHEMRDVDGAKLILREEDFIEMLGVFMGEHPDARKIEQGTQTSINRLVKMGFLTKRTDSAYEVRPLIRAKVTADEMNLLKERLTNYVQQDDDMDEDDDDTLA